MLDICLFMLVWSSLVYFSLADYYKYMYVLFFMINHIVISFSDPSLLPDDLLDGGVGFFFRLSNFCLVFFRLLEKL